LLNLWWVIIKEMKVLFVCSGNASGGINPIIINQGNSLINYGNIEVDFYAIKGKGLKGYLKNIKPLRQQILKGQYSIIHAHYSSTAYVASLAGANPLVVSLMGSDVKGKKINKFFIQFAYLLFSWKAIIVKSEEMKKLIGIKDVVVIPNGVELGQFKVVDKENCKALLGWSPNRIHLLFASNPERRVKNFPLLIKAIKLLDVQKQNIDLHCLKNIPNAEVPIWYNAADVVTLTSFWEGSPNVIKEAMACDCPIVSTDVGDVRILFNDEPGYFLTNFDETECSNQINKAISFSIERGKTNGRQRIIDLSLDAQSITKKIISLYQKLL